MRSPRLITFILGGTGVLGLILGRALDNATLGVAGILLLLVAAAALSVETIVTRQDVFSHGDSGRLDHVNGLPALLSGLANLLLVLVGLGLALALVAGVGGELFAFFGKHLGLLAILAGVWLLLNYSGELIRQGLNLRASDREGRADWLMELVNRLLTKIVSLALALIGAGLVVLGLWNLV